MLAQNVLYYGEDKPLPEQRKLCAGALSLVYEAGDLRYIKLGDREIVRRLYIAVRDQNWGTVPPILSKVQMEIKESSFRITYHVCANEGALDFVWKATIVGHEDSTISFTMEGEARSTFWRNRIGFCVLHPMHECAGVACRIEHVDGTVTEGVFPDYIAPQLVVDGRPQPHQPFAEMHAMSYPVQSGLWADIRFEGDIFEIEDQRNWTDASFKTYCTPLRLPFPTKVEKGATIHQSVTIALSGKQPSIGLNVPTKPTEVVISVEDRPPGALPAIGLSAAAHEKVLRDEEIERLKQLNLTHLRVDLPLGEPKYLEALKQANGEAKELGVGLEIALFLTDEADAELARLREELEHIRPKVTRWLLFWETEEPIAEQLVLLARSFLEDYDPAARFGTGSNSYFAQLNRSRPPVELLDFVCYAINPQAHAFDNASLVETLEAQGATVKSAQQFIAGLPVAITPVTLKPPRSPNVMEDELELEANKLPSSVDPRQMSLFGAGWTLNSLKYLAEAGAASLTYYETTGWRGVMATENGSPLPEKFPSLPGCVFPLYHVLADVGAFAGGEVIPVRSSNPLSVDGIVLRKEGVMRLVLANLSGQPQQVRLPKLGRKARLWLLDETNAEMAMSTPATFRERSGEPLDPAATAPTIALRPYAVARVDCENVPR